MAVYRNHYGTFSGDTARKIIEELYKDSARITKESQEEWWNAQKRTWGEMYSESSPSSEFPKWPGSLDSPESESACQKFLDFLVKIEAVEEKTPTTRALPKWGTKGR
jgi:hypothetical protein